jgi:uncharacterized membrane protein required for colicin V production
MGLDLAFGAIVLLLAIRGWLKGFIAQAIRLAGVVACVYAADPVRDLVKPYISPHLPSVGPELVDRLLWWLAAAVCYVVLVGLASVVHNVSRRRTFGLDEPRRNDQYAGFALGAVKGLIVALFLVAGLDRYVLARAKGVAWAEDQLQASKVLKWNAQYQPVAWIWASPPIRHFVDHIQRMGLNPPAATAAAALEINPLQASSGPPPRLVLPGIPGQEVDAAGVREAFEAVSRQLNRLIPKP